MLCIMLLKLVLAWLTELHGDELEALGLKAGDDLTNESSLDTIGLDHDESSFFSCRFNHSSSKFKI